MAENEVIIHVKSTNDTKAGFDSAKRDAEIAGEDAGQGFAAKFAARFGSFMAGTNGIGGESGSLMSALTSGPGIAGIAVAAGALLTELNGLVAGFSAATAGAGAFYILGHNTIQQLIQDYVSLQTAQEAVQKAQDKYNLDPTKSNLAALKTAQLNLAATQQGAQQDLGAAAPAVDSFAAALGRLQQAFQPVLFQVLSNAFNALAQFLPYLTPLANAFAAALSPMLIKLGEFAQSQGFQDWFKQFLALVGPSTTAILQGIGELIIAFGKFLTVLSAKDVVNAINIAFTVLVGTIEFLTQTVQIARYTWDYVWHALEQTVITVVGAILTAADTAFGWVPGLGPKLDKAKTAFDAWASGIQADLDGLQTSGNTTIGVLAGVGYAALHAFTPATPGTGPGAAKVGHLAGGGYGSGWTVVGENGPELVDLPGGSYVHPASSLSAMGAAGGPVVIQLGGGGGSQLEQIIWNWMVREVRVRGGGGKNSVQIALGQTH